MFFDTVATSLPLHRAGKLKILGIASPERFAAVPEIPTVAESGLPGFRSVTWFGLVAPPGTPTAIAEKINQAVAASFKKADVGIRLSNLMLEPIGGTPADGAKFIAGEAALWSRVIKDNNIPMR
jgi:tripartite-type tricarboxylate transporter receptor subunit TctC